MGRVDHAAKRLATYRWHKACSRPGGPRDRDRHAYRSALRAAGVRI